MQDLFVNKCFTLISKYHSLDHYNEVKIMYGLESLYHFITKTIGILLLSCFLGIIKQNLLIFLFYGPLRMFGHGLHAKNNIECWILSIITYVVLGNIVKYVYIYKMILVSFIILSILSFCIWAPADTESKPIINKKLRNIMRTRTLIISAIYTIIFVFLYPNILTKVLSLSMLLEAILINPITYKCFKAKYNNYINYI